MNVRARHEKHTTGNRHAGDKKPKVTPWRKSLIDRRSCVHAKPCKRHEIDWPSCVKANP